MYQSTRFLGVAVASLLGLLVATASAEAAPPATVGFRGEDVARVKASITAGDWRFATQVQRITRDAEKALTAGPFSVVNKQYSPPSGDKHDYASLSPYWWPDPSKPDGLPYIRKDGQVNPERSKYDLDSLNAMSDAVWDLGLGYYLTDNATYAKKAAELLRVWFLDEQTRMNPNVKYAQFRPGHDLAPYGVIETTRLLKVLDAERLIRGSEHWSAGDQRAFEQWVRQFMQYLLTSEQGQAEAKSPNNHGSWYATQVASHAIYLGEHDLAKQIIQDSGRRLIASQIEPDGSQPHELARTRPYHYSRYNLRALMDLARLGDRVGVDLWTYKTDDGRSLRAALDYLIPFATKRKPMERKEISDPKLHELYPLLRWAAVRYDAPEYEQAIDQIDGIDRNASLVEVLYPTPQP